MFLLRSLDREPMVVLGALLGLTGVSFALIAPQVRQRLGYDTSQWHGLDYEKRAYERSRTAEFVRETLGKAPTLRRQ